MPESLAEKSSKGKDTVQAQEHSAEVARRPIPTNPRGAALALQRSAGNQAFNHLLGQGFRTLPSTNGLLQHKCACGNNTMAGGECEECGKKQRLGLQTKLKVNEPGDVYEQEADRIADQVMATPAHSAVREAPLSVQRFSGQSNGQMNAAPASVDQVLASPGRPLEPALRQDMEQRFGHDFSRVRVHTGGTAEQSALDVNAQAFTMGGHIVFGAGQFAPWTQAGRRLIAHELTHVAQQQSDIPQNGALAFEANRAEAAVAQGGNSAVALERRAGTIQRQPTQPTLIKIRPGVTKRIDDVYGAGSLDEPRWRNLLDSAEQAYAKGDRDGATRAYLILYADVAKLAQATFVVTSSGGINVVTGDKKNCKDARPGLNFSLLSLSEWGDHALATTAYVDQGKLGTRDRPKSLPVAIVLNRSAFKHKKEETLAVLRHEMAHAEHYIDGTIELSDPKAGSGHVVTSMANTELLGYVEGFMTMFHLAHPAPTSDKDPAFSELLGALSTTKIFTWDSADPLVRSEALGRIQEYYCNALDRPYREAFDGWVISKLGEARKKTSKIITGESPPGSLIPGEEDFFNGLQGIITRNCKGFTTMKL